MATERQQFRDPKAEVKAKASAFAYEATDQDTDVDDQDVGMESDGEGGQELPSLGRSSRSIQLRCFPYLPPQEEKEVTILFPFIAEKREVPQQFKLLQLHTKGEIADAVAKVDLDKFKFLLGPALYPIQCQHLLGEDAEHAWQRYAIQHKMRLYERINEAIDILSTLLKMDEIIRQRELMMAALADEKEDQGKIKFNQIKASHEAAKLLGLEQYDRWVEEHASDIALCQNGTVLDASPISFADNEILLNDVNRDPVKILLIKWGNDWIIEQSKNSHHPPQFAAQISSYAKKMLNHLLRNLQEARNLHIFKQMLQENHACLIVQLNKIAKQQEKNEVEYKKRIENEKQNFVSFAREWLSSDKSRKDSALLLQPNPDYDYKGLTAEELVQLLVEYSVTGTARCYDVDWLEHINECVGKIRDQHLQDQFKAELAKHLFDARFNPTFALMQNLNKSKEYGRKLLSDGKSDKEKKYCLSVLAGSSHWFKTLIPEPLECSQLKLILSGLHCKSEAQMRLKMLLLNHLNARDLAEWKPWLNAKIKQFDLRELKERRRLVEYLISCLFWARKKQADEGILFNSIKEISDSQEAEQSVPDVKKEQGDPVGIDLVLAYFEERQIRSSDLKAKLISYLHELQNNVLFYLQDHKKIKQKINSTEKPASMVRVERAPADKDETGVVKFSPRGSALVNLSLSRPRGFRPGQQSASYLGDGINYSCHR